MCPPISRLAPLLFVGCASVAPQPAPPSAPAHAELVREIDGALERATRFLLAQQGDDGGWHSTTYAPFKDGRAITPVVLSALTFAPPNPAIESAYQRASDFIARSLIGPDGKLAPGPYGLNYPVYTLSGALLVLSTPVNARYEEAKEVLVEALLAAQLSEAHGWSSDDLEYGGWGYFSGAPQKTDGPRDDLLTSNLTSTLFATGALLLAGVPLDEPVFEKALLFVKRCQNFPDDDSAAPGPHDDGGFFFTPTNDTQNKAGLLIAEKGKRPRYRSYGTMSADGLRFLYRLGIARSSPRTKAAMEWVLAHFRPDRTPGDFLPDREVQRDSSYYYYVWSIAHALMLTGPPAETDPRTQDWPLRLARAVIAKQRPDGSYANASVDMREDDPLIATPFAIAGLAICRLMLTDHFRTSFPMPIPDED